MSVCGNIYICVTWYKIAMYFHKFAPHSGVMWHKRGNKQKIHVLPIPTFYNHILHPCNHRQHHFCNKWLQIPT